MNDNLVNLKLLCTFVQPFSYAFITKGGAYTAFTGYRSMVESLLFYKLQITPFRIIVDHARLNTLYLSHDTTTIFSPTRPSGPSWSSSRDVRLSV